jgi:Recombination endonuclease VII
MLRVRRDGHLRRKYGLTADQFDAMLARQGGGCAICGRTKDRGRSLAVDHDAVTGALRGILCQNCNRAIGQLGHDPDRLRKATRYLERAARILAQS